MSDNPSSESTALSAAEAKSAFASIISTDAEVKPKQEAKVETAEPTEEELASAVESEEEAQDNAQEEGASKFTIKVDGKDVELSESDIAEAYKSGLRQSDYTKKTMEAAETRKVADAEIAKARQERNSYAEKLQEQTVILQNALEQQNSIDWQQLLDNDPVEYLKQQHLYQQRQTAYQTAQQEAAYIKQQQKQEDAKNFDQYVTNQHEELVAKIPAWKDEAKAKTEKIAIRDYLKNSGFDDGEIGRVSDHRSVILARKAMLYDQVMKKAQAAAKKVQTAPQRVERPGNGASQNVDQRSSAFQRLNKSGSVNDAAAVFASLI